MDYSPPAIFLSIGSFNIYYYGLILVLAISLASILSRKRLLKENLLSSEKIEDLFFYLIIGGLIGARLGHVFFFQWSYYSKNLIDIIKVWQGGLAIQGALLAGLLIIFIFARQNKIKFFQLSDNLVPFLALGQALGRWGNYFNQELFGQPTTQWYGIFIALEKRVKGFEEFNYFQPTFFYESFLNLILFFILMKILKIKKLGLATLSYLLGYSLIRFSLEYIRIDEVPLLFGIRFPQFLSFLVIIITIFIIYKMYFKVLSKDNK